MCQSCACRGRFSFHTTFSSAVRTGRCAKKEKIVQESARIGYALDNHKKKNILSVVVLL
jgi:hypothetical protein